MTPPPNLSELEVVGYADVLEEHLLPSVVPPVFRLRARPDRFILPPYFINGGAVWNGIVVETSDAERLQRAEEIYLFPAGQAPFSALPEHELWVDQSFALHYEPIGSVKRTLRELAGQQIRLAEEAIAAGQLDEALEHGGAAIWADDRRLEPLAIRAAVSRIRMDRAGELLMAEMASGALSEQQFNLMVADYVSRMPLMAQV